MSSFIRKMQRRLKRGQNRLGKHGLSSSDKTGTRLIGFTNPVVKQASACRGSRRGKHREGFSVQVSRSL